MPTSYDRPDRRRRALLQGIGLGAVAPPSPAPGASAPRIGVSLGSGSFHGFTHIGVIRAFERIGIRPYVITGTSIGAVAGVLWAAGRQAAEIAQLAMDPSWREADRWRLPGLGLARWTRLPDFIDRHAAPIEDLPIRFAAVATDLASGRPVVLDRGPAGRAVAASASVPIRFEPVTIDGLRLVDGALSAPVPIDAARAAGADFVIAVDVAYRPYEAPVTGLTDVGFQMLHIMINRLSEEQSRRADHVLRLDVHAMVGDDPTPLIDAGDRALADAWPAIRERLTAGPRPAACRDT